MKLVYEEKAKPLGKNNVVDVSARAYSEVKIRRPWPGIFKIENQISSKPVSS